MAQTQSTTSKRSFKHLNSFDRGRIAALLQEGKSPAVIAKAIGCDRSTISREIKRGTVTQMKTGRKIVNAYFPETGQLKYEENRHSCGAKLKLDDAIEFIQYAEIKILKDNWSPDAVCGSAALHEQFEGKRVCTKTLYNYIELGYIGVKNIDLPMKVRLNTKKRRIRVNKRVLGRSIEERPEAVEERAEFGHWEIDTVIGKKSQDEALMTLTERKTRQEIILRIDDKDSDSITKALEMVRNKFDTNFAQVFKTITSDNGSEFAELAASFEKEKTEVFFTHPYTSCERGTNERHNGLIRRFIPKGKAIRSVAEETIRYAEDWCNRLPRKILGYRTPEACFLEELAHIA
ncbi:IS30 family transposase [Planococcus sp. ANT_H30]|uniref:IS30 family transposase n=1 Tax=Planococcus sp. ANT_H30 TaxID=2597347 RepID=UPI0011EE447B|nr:IS30 family transposase [Planococcus sp. ANT_H30]KAA0954733.1 IS30 family transposase [Planococcus sp. ANT_H30]